MEEKRNKFIRRLLNYHIQFNYDILHLLCSILGYSVVSTTFQICLIVVMVTGEEQLKTLYL